MFSGHSQKTVNWSSFCFLWGQWSKTNDKINKWFTDTKLNLFFTSPFQRNGQKRFFLCTSTLCCPIDKRELEYRQQAYNIFASGDIFKNDLILKIDFYSVLNIQYVLKGCSFQLFLSASACAAAIEDKISIMCYHHWLDGVWNSLYSSGWLLFYYYYFGKKPPKSSYLQES